MNPLGLIILWLLCFISSPVVAFLQQYVGVRGRLLCGKTPLPNARVKLWDKNFIGSDTKLDETKTDKNGEFQVEGGKSALFTMDVRLKIYHDCEDKLVGYHLHVYYTITKFDSQLV
ncbi:Transthyretin-like family protein [Oesophagostomum dentatum]|uniref:Transthyretin-like family protein n=1 Tax=Oesophagostomum dentatum TaxID=61180 RepID=A0A0B1TBB6_OESDE|nr:Transthyretin-like family protein [Oesophagostomum dentatum]